MSIINSEVFKMKPEEVILFSELLPIAKEAMEAEKIIKEAYCYKVGQNAVTIWEDSYNAEYLTHNGIWQARYLHQTYDVECTAESIYNLFKNELIYVKKYSTAGYYENQALIARYFRVFLDKTKKMYQKLHK